MHGYAGSRCLFVATPEARHEVHYLKKLHNRIECLDCIGAPLLLLAALLSPEDDEYGDLPPEAAEERKGPDESSEGSRTQSVDL